MRYVLTGVYKMRRMYAKGRAISVFSKDYQQFHQGINNILKPQLGRTCKLDRTLGEVR